MFWGLILFCCNRGGERQIRHYSVLNTLAAILRQSGIAIASERTLSSVGDIGSAAHGLRMDILAYIRSNSPCLIDVSVTHPIPQNPESPSLTRNARHTGSAALARENSKRHTYAQAVASLGLDFYPTVVETFCRWGHPACVLLLRAVHSFAADFAVDGPSNTVIQAIMTKWWRKLSCSLQISNVNLLLSRIHSGAHAQFAGQICRNVNINPPPCKTKIFRGF